MALHVDDFGCVPDGRFLEQVFIDAGAAALTVSDGLLRAGDVGRTSRSPVPRTWSRPSWGLPTT